MLFLSLPPNNHKCVPHRCFTNTSSHLTTLPLNPILPNPLLPNPYCAPYTQPLGSTPVTHPPCHYPNLLIPFIPLSPSPSTIIHAPIWCRGRSPSTGPRAVFAEWDQFGFLFSVCDDAVWAILNTPPGGVLRARPDFPAPADLAVMVLLSVTPSNAPRPPGQPGWQSQLLSVQRSWIA